MDSPIEDNTIDKEYWRYIIHFYHAIARNTAGRVISMDINDFSFSVYKVPPNIIRIDIKTKEKV